MSEGVTKVTRETVEQRSDERGASVDLANGVAQVPNGPGTETKVINGQETVGVSKELFIKLCEEAGQYHLAAEARGQKYRPSILERGFEQLNKPVTFGKAILIVTVGAATVWVAKKSWNLLSKRFGWGIYKTDSSVMPQSQMPELGMDNNVQPRARRQPPAAIAQA